MQPQAESDCIRSFEWADREWNVGKSSRSSSSRPWRRRFPTCSAISNKALTSAHKRQELFLRHLKRRSISHAGSAECASPGTATWWFHAAGIASVSFESSICHVPVERDRRSARRPPGKGRGRSGNENDERLEEATCAHVGLPLVKTCDSTRTFRFPPKSCPWSRELHGRQRGTRRSRQRRKAGKPQPR
jgi:hypothetical protein